MQNSFGPSVQYSTLTGLSKTPREAMIRDVGYSHINEDIDISGVRRKFPRWGSKHRRSQEGPKQPCPPKFLENIVILCFEKRLSKPNSDICLKLSILVYTAEYLLYIFIFLGFEGGHGTVPPISVR